MNVTFTNTKPSTPEIKFPFFAYSDISTQLIFVTAFGDLNEFYQGYLASSNRNYDQFEYFSNDWPVLHFKPYHGTITINCP